jgi:hypothetical protein
MVAGCRHALGGKLAEKEQAEERDSMLGTGAKMGRREGSSWALGLIRGNRRDVPAA